MNHPNIYKEYNYSGAILGCEIKNSISQTRNQQC